MTALNKKRRRTAAVQFADHVEACEVRVLLSGVAIYPAPAVTKETAPVSTDTQSNLVVLTPADYNGSWDVGGGSILQLVVKGSDPETGKVKGTLTSPIVVGGSVKFKGKITNGIELNGKSQGKGIFGLITAKFKTEIEVNLTDSTHFEGMGTTLIKGSFPTSGTVNGVKI